MVVIVTELIVGTWKVIWCAQKIKNAGISNGFSLVSVASVGSPGPTMLINAIEMVRTQALAW